MSLPAATLKQQYAEDGYCLIENMIGADVAARLLADVGEDIHRVGVDKFLCKTSIHTHPGVEIYSHGYKLLNSFQWGMTALVSEIAGVELAPAFAYFQIYQKGNRLLVHSDRPSCEHSMSLTLAYSDGLPWDITVGRDLVDHEAPEEDKKIADDHGGAAYATIATQPGDAVLYPGWNRRHGRLAPNPNRWSAHVFLHWVEKDGPNADKAFDGRARDTAIDFDIPGA